MLGQGVWGLVVWRFGGLERRRFSDSKGWARNPEAPICLAGTPFKRFEGLGVI